MQRVPGVQAAAAALHLPLHGDPDPPDPQPAHLGTARQSALRPLHALAAPGPGGAAQGVAGLHLRLQAHPVQLRTSCPRCSDPNVELVTDPIDRLTAGGVHTADGTEREVDCIIYGTGFRTTEFMFPMEITGSGGASLNEQWREGAHAHLGVTVPGVPLAVPDLRPQHQHLGRLDHPLRGGPGRVHPPGAPARAGHGGRGDHRAPRRRGGQRSGAPGRFAGTAWTQCDSWYRNESGRIVTNWPGYMREYEERLRELDLDEYELVPLPEPAPATAVARVLNSTSP